MPILNSYYEPQNGDVRMRTVKQIMQLLMPHWHKGVRADSRHAFGRTLTRDYLRRREMVKNFWVVAGLMMVVQPLLPWVVWVSLFTTFMSFMYLDEAPVYLEEWAEGC